MRMSDTLGKEIKTALMQNEVTRQAAMNVFHRRGIILLWGEVETEEIARAAGHIASRRPGVVKVINDLAINELEDEEFFNPNRPRAKGA